MIVRGKMVGTLDAGSYVKDRRALLDTAVESYRKLEREAALVIVEGAGSPAEINLRKNDIANMGLAQALNLPVILVGDIDRGHVIAALVGTHTVLDATDRALIHGFIVNKFRGRPELFTDGLRTIVQHTGWASIGVVPWLSGAARLPAEDSVPSNEGSASRVPSRVKIVVPLLSRIANFDDFDPLRQEPGVELVLVPPGQPLPSDARMIILPGTKSTIADLEFLRTQGWDIDVLSHARRGGRILGLCGGYQMLGRTVSDPAGIEGPPRTVNGLGLLDVETVMTGDKTLREVSGKFVDIAASPTGLRDERDQSLGAADAKPGDSEPAGFTGYEMHVGSTSGNGLTRPFLRFSDGTVDGASSTSGHIAGCYVHGLFAATAARSAFVKLLGVVPSGEDYVARVDEALDEIASALERYLDIERLAGIAGLQG